MRRGKRDWSRLAYGIVLIAFCVAQFLIGITIIGPPDSGLDPAWTQVLTWSYLHDLQWGRDIVFTYGPLGFAGPYTSYVSGAFGAHVSAQILLSAAFAFATGLLFSRAGAGTLSLFAAAVLCGLSRLPADIGWALTLVFATTHLINCCKHESRWLFSIVALIFAPAFAAIALTKFSMVPLWLCCVGALAAVCLVERSFRLAALILVAFPGAVLATWVACGQHMENFASFLWVSLDVAIGYRHAMGLDAPTVAEWGAMATLAYFATVCTSLAWRARADRRAVVACCLSLFAGMLAWVAFLTRGDHWPWFFLTMALLPFALLCNSDLAGRYRLGAKLIPMVLAGAITAVTQEPSAAVPYVAYAQVRNSLFNLTHLADLRQAREAQWLSAAAAAALPGFRQRIGDARVDLLTLQQGVILLNEFNYAPRPAFQSYLAYTPWLARLNEAYFLGSDAPEFAVLKIEAIDNRLATSEDALALLALLRRYRPVLEEHGFLLLQRDASLNSVAPVAGTDQGASVSLGTPIPIAGASKPTLAFVHVELSMLGNLYSMLFREPALAIDIRTTAGDALHYRLIRSTAASGFLISPLVQSVPDWIKLYISEPLPIVQDIRIAAENAWQQVLFQPELRVAFRPADMLHADGGAVPRASGAASYPGFNLMPTKPESVRIVKEDGFESVFVHAPASIELSPRPGRYKVVATFGILNSALQTPSCVHADPDGVGVSIIVRSPHEERTVWHAEIDPFHVPSDAGPHQLFVEDLDLDDGEALDYRVDPGAGGENTSCDWTYVRNLVLTRHGRLHAAGHDDILADGFE